MQFFAATCNLIRRFQGRLLHENLLIRSRPGLILVIAWLFMFAPAYSQTPADITVIQDSTANLGGPLPGLSADQLLYFRAARKRFQEVDSVTGSLPGESGTGLGPRFNGNSCAGCHAFPTVGGSSPPSNPQIRMATLDGASNSIPFFITSTGPVREARFALNPDGTLDGAVHQVFTIAGRSDASSCTTPQPDFAAQMASGNVGFRIPTALFGLGLVEAIPDVNLQAAFDNSASLRASFGVRGHFNQSANDATIARFGWKAQNKSLLLFAGEAYNVEQGVSNELFPNEVNADSNCATNSTPEDASNLENAFHSGSPASDYSSDIVNFAAFSRLSFPPLPRFSNTTTQLGQQVFQAIGCQSCHIVQQTTGLSSVAASISNVTFEPYSDFALHGMGDGLADGVIQGTAQGNEFRSAPLWGLGSRLFFLHDGRTSDLNQAILAHASNGSEANTVIQKYRQLSDPERAFLLRFLNSL